MFAKHKRATTAFDRTGKVPVLRSSICTGERVAGFKDLATGALLEERLILTDADLQAFLREYGLTQADLRREW